MSVQKHWNIHECRASFESDEHWNLKQEFLEVYKDQFDKDRLLCLAQVYLNIELLGCRYPLEVMNQIKSLATNLGQKYKANKTNTLQRTFVAASDAAASKAKGETPNYNKPSKRKLEKCLSVEETQESISAQGGISILPVTMAPKKPKIMNEQFLQSDSAKEIKPKRIPITAPESSPAPCSSNDTHECDDLFGFTLKCFENRPNSYPSILQTSAQYNHAWLEYAEDNKGSFPYIVMLNQIPVGCGNSWKEATKDAVVKLSKKYVTLMVSDSSSTRVSMDQLKKEEKVVKKEAEKVPESSMGAQMLRMMGWTGGGLGVKQDGIVEPVKASAQFKRSGLGSSISGVATLKAFGGNVDRMLKNYAKDDTYDDLIFSKELSKQNRKKIHEIVRRKFRNSLKSRSRGGGKNRFLTVFKTITDALVPSLVEDGPAIGKYRLLSRGTIDFTKFFDN